MHSTPNQPQNMVQLMKTGFYLWKKSVSQAIPFALALAVLNLSLYLFLRDYQGTLNITWEYEDINAHTGLVLLAFMLVFMIVYIAMLHTINQIARNQVVNRKEALHIGIKKLLPFLMVSLVTLLAIIGGFLAFFIPGVIISGYVVFAPYLVATEDKKILEAIQESFRLVYGSWWYVTTVVSLVILTAVVLMTVFIWVVAYLDVFLIMTLKTVYRARYFLLIAEGIFTMLFYPWSAAILLTLLQDLQIRKSKKKSDKQVQIFKA